MGRPTEIPPKKATPTSMEIPHGSMAKYISTNDAKSQSQFGSPTIGPFCIMAENIKWYGMFNMGKLFVPKCLSD